MALLGKTHLSEHGEALTLDRSEDPTDTGVATLGTRKIHWYAVQTCSRHEKRVREHLEFLRVPCYLPLYEAVHRWRNGCNAKVELPLFPNYLFVNIDIRERVSVLDVPGVISFVGSGNKALPLADFEIESLRNGLHMRKFEPHDYLAVGQRVRIKSGPLENLSGVLVRKNGGLRVVISVDLIKQSVAVEVDEADVEPIHAVSSRPM
jgi:transcription antitermination factor NusG